MLRMSSTESGQVKGYNPVDCVRQGNCVIYSCPPCLHTNHSQHENVFSLGTQAQRALHKELTARLLRIAETASMRKLCEARSLHFDESQQLKPNSAT
jgi:hypothetical protein